MFVRAGLFSFLCASLIPSGLDGQLPEPHPWEIRVFAEAGGLVPIRKLSSNNSFLTSELPLQVVSELTNSSMVGGGVDIALGDPSVRLRGIYRQSVGLESDGFLLVAQLDIPGPLGVVHTVEGTVREMIGELAFMQGTPGNRARGVIFLGLGVRSYNFSTLDCSSQNSEDEALVCNAISDMWEEESSFNPLLAFGLGLEVNLSGPHLFVQARGVVSPYRGGTSPASGDTVMDLVTNVGLSWPIR